MENPRLSEPGTIIKEAWQIAGKQRLFWVGVTIIYFLLNFLINRFFPPTSDYSNWQQILRSEPLNFVFTTIITIGIVRMGLVAVSGKVVVIDDLWNSIHQLPRYAAASILFTIIVILGFVALILPGFYFALRFSQFGYFILDHDAGIMESLKMSWDTTRGSELSLLWAYIVVGLFVFLGILALGIGILFTAPVGIIAGAIIYRQLTSAK